MANNTVKLAVEEATKRTTAGDGRIVRIIGPVVDVKFDGAHQAPWTGNRKKKRPRSC